MAERTNVPEIRFAGFTDPWEQRKLGELLLFQNGFNGSSESFGSGIPLISVMDVLDDEFITHETVRGKARLNCEEASRYCVEYGDVLFQRSSENREDAGTSNVYLDQHVSSAFGGFVIRGKKVGEYNPIFIKYLLGSPFIREQITHRAQGAQHINVSQDTLADVVLLMPSMREQEAVGLVFLHLDNLITLHQRKHDKLVQLKKSMLDKMFPKPGETEPEIRFAGFTDPWEQRKLGEIIQLGGSGGTPSATNPNYYGGEIPFLGIADIEGRDIAHTAKTLTKEGLRNSAAWIVPAGAVSLAMYASVGKVGIIRQDTATSQAFYNMVFEDVAIRDFVFTRLEKADASLEWEPYISTGTQRNLNADKVKAFAIAVPGSREAAKIGRYFANLDFLITLHQRKLELLRNTKKSLLDRMFV